MLSPHPCLTTALRMGSCPCFLEKETEAWRGQALWPRHVSVQHQHRREAGSDASVQAAGAPPASCVQGCQRCGWWQPLLPAGTVRGGGSSAEWQHEPGPGPALLGPTPLASPLGCAVVGRVSWGSWCEAEPRSLKHRLVLAVLSWKALKHISELCQLHFKKKLRKKKKSLSVPGASCHGPHSPKDSQAAGRDSPVSPRGKAACPSAWVSAQMWPPLFWILILKPEQ